VEASSNGRAIIWLTRGTRKGLVELEKYPRLKEYFEKHGAALKKRHTAQKQPRPDGIRRLTA
jgi:hypothetical protein